MVIDTGRPTAAVAWELGIGTGLLGRWVKAERERSGQIPADELDTDKRAESDLLRKELAELKLDNEFLGKAAAFFASRQRK
ncbi:hypothetical protein [Corynebacterium testudinoris]|uniref:hypothetical protein n=1 Tax=Corynebacterium testudinoris TaxID=136857 RepID=UPI002E81D9FC|nr:hypothetical protein [Corynebacterium testudinoris]